MKHELEVMEIYSGSQVRDYAPLFTIVMFKAHADDRRRP